MGTLPIEVKAKKKVKRKLTEEQRAAAAERLAKARAARSANAGIPSNVHHTVYNLEDSHPLSLHNVRGWIKHTREKITAERRNLHMGQKGAEARIASMEGYIRHLNAYIMTGNYIDNFYGEEQQHRIQGVCTTPAYDKDGNIKRQVGVWYRDICDVWTQEMDTEWRRTGGW